jgi:hypothetical protein
MRASRSAGASARNTKAWRQCWPGDAGVVGARVDEAGDPADRTSYRSAKHADLANASGKTYTGPIGNYST